MRPAALAVLLAACGPTPPELPDLGPARALAAEVQAENLLPLVERLAEGHLRDSPLDCTGYEVKDQYPACHLTRDDAVELVRSTLAGLDLPTQVLVQGDAHNVEAELRGTTRPQEVVVVAAHVDAFHAGADDNSSAVAAMLEVARVAAAHRFARTVRFVGFDLEERGAVGSLRWTRAGRARDVVAALVLECLGFTAQTQDAPPGLVLGERGDFLAVGANESSEPLARTLLALNEELRVMPLRAVLAGGDGAFPFTGALLRSDNGPLWLQGVPAVMLTDTANFRNPNYHRASDMADTLDPAFLAASTRLVAASLAVLAEAEP